MRLLISLLLMAGVWAAGADMASVSIGTIEIGEAGLALAMHEADHRYTVSGYVRDEAGKPKSDAVVLVEHKVEGGQKKKVTTNWLGYYEVVFHLHTTNLDEQITVTLGSEVKTHQIKFNPEDTETERRGEVDFGAPASASGVGGWYAGGGVFLVAAALYFYKIKRNAAKKAVKKQKGHHGK